MMYPVSGPPFKHAGSNLETAFNYFLGRTAPPWLKPKSTGGSIETIKVEPPWTPKGQTETLAWVEIIEQ